MGNSMAFNCYTQVIHAFLDWLLIYKYPKCPFKTSHNMKNLALLKRCQVFTDLDVRIKNNGADKGPRKEYIRS